VKSLRHEDVFSINVFPQQVAVDSTRGTLHFFRYENYVIWTQVGLPPISLFQWETFDVPATGTVVSERIRSAVSMTSSNYGRDTVSHTVYTGTISYWAVTIPLALLSAWLLLSKPCLFPKRTVSPPHA
jgi:hypothetical protein